jgi:hypothetical protein
MLCEHMVSLIHCKLVCGNTTSNFVIYVPTQYVSYATSPVVLYPIRTCLMTRNSSVIIDLTSLSPLRLELSTDVCKVQMLEVRASRRRDEYIGVGMREHVMA